ncbi:hypothetical protein G3545_24905 [Starkeya sp. ORNL1]|uniref:hypothetical protein n=1 Tax=Starkeya sp. ORNL1 TaxID=2709380 RepID=UPI00146487FA|nr:hypothetical protein [Starkeya sp. ORNL1]QJP16588.1 hypothetical protein G3545_24905 [Starkeya sp. ORNL1]
MRTSIPGATPIPYGIDAASLARILPGAGEAPAGLPVAVVRPGEMLRINNAGLDLPAPGIGEPDMSVAERVAAHLTRLAGAWNAPAARFIERYFAFLDRQIETHRSELVARLAPFDGLFAPEDFIHSAPLPLPRACLFAPVEAHGGEPTPADYMQVDFAFWLGAAPVALLAAPSPLTPGAARRRDERLAAAGVTVFACGATDLADAEFGLFARVLREQGCRFWEGEALPSAPGTRGLPEF